MSNSQKYLACGIISLLLSYLLLGSFLYLIIEHRISPIHTFEFSIIMAGLTSYTVIAFMAYGRYSAKDGDEL